LNGQAHETSSFSDHSLFGKRLLFHFLELIDKKHILRQTLKPKFQGGSASSRLAVCLSANCDKNFFLLLLRRILRKQFSLWYWGNFTSPPSLPERLSCSGTRYHRRRNTSLHLLSFSHPLFKSESLLSWVLRSTTHWTFFPENRSSSTSTFAV